MLKVLRVSLYLLESIYGTSCLGVGVVFTLDGACSSIPTLIKGKNLEFSQGCMSLENSKIQKLLCSLAVSHM
jgi:hypothetical protein